jgi:hypothetical protein
MFVQISCSQQDTLFNNIYLHCTYLRVSGKVPNQNSQNSSILRLGMLVVSDSTQSRLLFLETSRFTVQLAVAILQNTNQKTSAKQNTSNAFA